MLTVLSQLEIEIVSERAKGKTPRSIYFAEKRGEPTKYNVIRKDIDEAMKMCINYGQFKKIMLKKGYIINDDYNRKYPTIKSINNKKPVRMPHLGTEYLPQNIARTVENNPYYYQNRYLKFTKTNRDECTTILNKHRKNLKTANYILEDTPKVKEVIRIEKQMTKGQEDIAKPKKKDRYIR